MIKVENECVGCPQGCINCGRKRVKRIYCDICGEEIFYESNKWDPEETYHVCEECEEREEEEEDD